MTVTAASTAISSAATVTTASSGVTPSTSLNFLVAAKRLTFLNFFFIIFLVSFNPNRPSIENPSFPCFFTSSSQNFLSVTFAMTNHVPLGKSVNPNVLDLSIAGSSMIQCSNTNTGAGSFVCSTLNVEFFLANFSTSWAVTCSVNTTLYSPSSSFLYISMFGIMAGPAMIIRSASAAKVICA